MTEQLDAAYCGCHFSSSKQSCSVHLCVGDDSGVEGRAGEAGLKETPGTASWWVARQVEPPEVVEVEPVVVEVILEG